MHIIMDKGCKVWQEYTREKLKKTNELDSTLIGGYNPRDYMAMMPNDHYMVMQSNM